MSELSVFVPGLPRPKGSMRAVPVGQHVRLIDGGGDDLAVWQSSVSYAAMAGWTDPPTDQPVVVVVDFHLPRPASAPKRRLYPDRRPDIDKLVRSILDALTGVVFTDDARVVHLIATKTFAPEGLVGASIRCRVLSDDPGPGANGRESGTPSPAVRSLEPDNPPVRQGREP